MAVSLRQGHHGHGGLMERRLQGSLRSQSDAGAGPPISFAKSTFAWGAPFRSVELVA